jgi:hypothetical protein
MGWFDVAATPGGRSYSVAAYRTGTIRIGAVPGATPAGASLGSVQDGLLFALLGRLLNVVLFRGSWTVRVAPWYGHRGKRWKVRVQTEEESDRRAEALFQLIKTGQWDPAIESPPQPARAD